MTPLKHITRSTGTYVLLKNRQFKSGITLLLVTMLIGFLFASCKQKESPVHGTYRIYSDDPVAKMLFAGENTYIRVNEDRTIIYNTTLNQKPKFHFEGTYKLDEQTNTLDIQWKSGKMPSKLSILKEKEDYVIRIGETMYKKEKTSS